MSKKNNNDIFKRVIDKDNDDELKNIEKIKKIKNIKNIKEKEIYSLLNDVDSSDLLEEFDSFKDIEELRLSRDTKDKGTSCITNLESNSKKKNKKQRFFKVASVVLALMLGAFGLNQASGGVLFSELPFVNLPFEKSDYNTFKDYVYTPKKENVSIGNANFSVLGVVLDGDIVHVSSLIKSNENKAVPDYIIELFIDGKKADSIGGKLSNPENPVSNSSFDFSVKGFDMNKKNDIKVEVRFLDNNDKASLRFKAELNNIEKISKVVNVNKVVKENGVTVKVNKVSVNPFRAIAEMEFVVDDYDKYKKMYDKSKSKIHNLPSNGSVIYVQKNVNFILDNEKLNYRYGVESGEIKGDKLIEKNMMEFVSSEEIERYDYKQLLNSKLYENISNAKIEIGYEINLYVNTLNSNNEVVLKEVKKNEKTIIIEIGE